MNWIIAVIVWVALAVALSMGLYYLVPYYLVRRFGVDYKKRRVDGRFVNPDPNHALIVLRGTKKVRAVVGSNYRLFRGDINDSGAKEDFNGHISLDGSEGLWVVPKRASEPDEIGGNLDVFVGWLDAWVYQVTGHRVIGSTIADLFNAKLASYDLDRSPEERHTTPKTEEDISFYVDLAKQVIRYRVQNADTGAIEPIEYTVEGKTERFEYRSAIEVNATGQVTVLAVNLDRWFFGVDRTFENLRQLIVSSLVEAIRDANADLLRNKDWVRKNIDPAPLLKNGRIPEGILTFYRDSFEINKETVADERFNMRIDEAKRVAGAVTEFGLIISGSRNDEIEFDENFKKFLRDVQERLRQISQDIRIKEGDVIIAGLEKKANETRAIGLAAIPERRYEAIARGASRIRRALGRDQTLAANVLVADSYGNAVKESEGNTIFVNAGGLQAGPSPVVDLTPRKKEK